MGEIAEMYYEQAIADGSLFDETSKPRRTRRPRMGILPTKRHAPRTSMSHYVWLIYGPPKIGKTTFANDWPDVLFIATEPGTAAMHAMEINISTWTDFEGVLFALESEPSKHLKTIAIDTVDNLWEFLVDHVCTENGWQDLGDGGFGKGYKLARRKLTSAIARLRKLTQAIVFISHERRDVVESRNEKKQKIETSFITSQLPGSARKVLHGSVDFILRAEMTPEGDRVLRTQPFRDEKTEIECGSRGIPSRPLADMIPLEFSDLKEAFYEAFPNETSEVKSKPKTTKTEKTETILTNEKATA
jgi:hypothetical protein